MMEKIIEIRNDHAAKTKFLFYAILLGLVLLLYKLSHQIIPYLIVCGVVWTLFCLRLLFIKLTDDKAPVIIVDSEGVLDKRLQVGKILWSDIDRVYTFRTRSVTWICIETKRDHFYLSRCGQFMANLLTFRADGLSLLSIRTDFLDLEHGQLFDIIAKKQQFASGR